LKKDLPGSRYVFDKFHSLTPEVLSYGNTSVHP
jgi:hypothetical protein